MTWSLKLRNGDLDLSAASYGTVTGAEKLVQDLRCFILERMGTDSLHPEYGSLVDGGRRPDGTYVRGVIGLRNSGLAQLEIESDLRRIVGEYQQRQLARAREDKARYGKTTFSRGEVIVALNNIEFVSNLDTVSVTLRLRTASDIEVQVPINFTQ